MSLFVFASSRGPTCLLKLGSNISSSSPHDLQVVSSALAVNHLFADDSLLFVKVDRSGRRFRFS
jgi:hypothetical protein